VFVLLTAAFVALAASTVLLPETVTPTGGARAMLRPRVSVPPKASGAFLQAAPTMISTWMLGGLMLSVGGSLLAGVFGQHDHAVVGGVIGAFATAAAVTSVLLRNRPAIVMARVGTSLLVVGTALFAAGVQQSWLTVFVVGAVIAGAGFGPAFLGAFGTLSQLAAPHERAGLISAIYVVSYLAFSVPALVAGLLITHDGLRETSLGYALVVGTVAAATLAYELLVLRRRGFARG
jgi:MFS family permease